MLVLYDSDCPLCRTLAGYMQKRAGTLTFQAWQEQHPDTPPQDLQIQTDDRLIAGPEAWQLLLQTHPDLQGLNWLAEKLGLTAATGRTLAYLGHAARRLCVRCPRR